MSKNLNFRVAVLRLLAYKIRDIKREIKNQDSFNILILGHSNPLPDGDCICSANGLALLLSEYMPMASVDIKYWQDTNDYINKVKGYVDNIVEDKPYAETFGSKELDKYYKYVFIVDTDFERTFFTGSMFDKFGQPEKVFIIDHHGTKDCKDDIRPTDSYDITCILGDNEENTSPSTSELIAILAVELKSIIDDKNASGETFEEPIPMNTMYKIYKICMGGIQTDTGGFLYEGFQLSLEAIAHCLKYFPSEDWKDFQVKQEKLTSIRYFVKDPKDSKVLSLLHGLVTAQANNIGVLVVNKEDMGDSALKPITVLQDYDFKAMIAITLEKEKSGFKYQESNVTKIKCELRSTEPTLNCRDIAKSIDASGGGHIQAAGVTIQIMNEKADEVVKSIIKKFQLEMKMMMGC